MAQTTDEIRRSIEAQRGQLAQDINELEFRVRDTMDWRSQFRKHTGLLLGLAFGGGVALALMTGGPRDHHSTGL
ncbi:MAG: DUF3618 domain-containing protein [Acidobacteria bacterium]|nr:DUF3618 domain-containing protein [Acidobacteriota bacterium]